MLNQELQTQYDEIYSYFKITNEPFDSLEWDGKKLEVRHKNRIIEVYSDADVKCLINTN